MTDIYLIEILFLKKRIYLFRKIIILKGCLKHFIFKFRNIEQVLFLQSLSEVRRFRPLKSLKTIFTPSLNRLENRSTLHCCYPLRTKNEHYTHTDKNHENFFSQNLSFSPNFGKNYQNERKILILRKNPNFGEKDTFLKKNSHDCCQCEFHTI